MSDPHSSHGKDGASNEKGWADRPGFIRAVFVLLFTACALAAGAGMVSAWHNPHPHFEVEGFPVFFAFYGFLAFMFIVLAGQHLRKLVGRKEDYYDGRE